MPRKKSDVEGQTVAFPDLNDSDEHKELMKRARAFKKADGERKQLLDTSKLKTDGLMTKLIEQLHVCELAKFKHDGLVVEIVPGKDKVIVKDDADDEAGDENGNE